MSFIRKILTCVVLSSIMTATAMAKETISIAWGFSLGSNQAATVRLLIEELNRIQNRYDFVLAARPGAGGTLAANFVTENPNTALVAMSSSFIVRPLFEKKDPTHNLDDFRPILVQGNGTPLVYVSQKFTNIRQVLQSPQELTVGVSGIGGLSHLATVALGSHGAKLTIVNFRNQQEASAAAAGGHVDLAVGFLADLQPLLDAGKLHVLAYTGRTDIASYPGLQLSKQGIRDVDVLTANYAIYASRRMSWEKFVDINILLSQAQNSPMVKQSLAKDMVEVANLTRSQSDDWYAAQRTFWQKQVEKIQREKK